MTGEVLGPFEDVEGRTQATSLIAAVAIIVMNIVVDIGYTVLDPRTRLS